MNSKNLRYLWLTIAAILGFFIGSKWNIPLAAWIAPIFVLRFFRDSDKAGRNFLLLWLITAIPTIISWNGATFFADMSTCSDRLSAVAETQPSAAWKSCWKMCRRLGSKSSNWQVTRTGSPACSSRR